MYKIIGSNNKVNYGAIDEAVDFNLKDFTLTNFFDRKKNTSLSRRLAFKTFNYHGLYCGPWTFGMASIKLGYLSQFFCYLYNDEKGMIFQKQFVQSDGAMEFTPDPDNYSITLKRRGAEVQVLRDINKGSCSVLCKIGSKLLLKAEIPFSIDEQKPIRVLNPNDPNRWTFTEKRVPLFPSEVSLVFDGQELVAEGDRPFFTYDWSGGFLSRNTNWYWANFGGFSDSGESVGLNAAAMVNETFYSENALWIGDERTRLNQCIFDLDRRKPMDTWKIFDESGRVDITFKPIAVVAGRRDNFRLMKNYFRQIVGLYSGTLRTDSGKTESFSNLRGFGELHRSHW